METKLSRLFFNQVQVLQKQLEHLLEKEPLDKKKEQTPRNFHAQTDLTQIDDMGLGLAPNLSERAPMLFSKLSLYFDSGLLFQRTGTEWKATAGFDQGDFFPLKGVEIQVPFRFPDMSLIEVRRVHSREIFSHLMDLQVLKSEKGQALIFKPHPDYIFMVTSVLADPWLKPHIERIQREILLLLGDY